VAWLLIAVPGIALAVRLGWPAPVRVKTALGGAVLVAAALHVVTGRQTASRPLVMASRALAVLVLAGTAAAFWLGVQAAS
jgi:hypothetical protein